jgi:hypothetical protein
VGKFSFTILFAMLVDYGSVKGAHTVFIHLVVIFFIQIFMFLFASNVRNFSLSSFI